MRYLTITLSLILALGCAAAAQASDNPFIVKYPFKSAIIQYKMDGSQKGTATLYVKGQTSARYTEAVSKVFGMTQKIRTIDITTPDKMIHVDLEEGKARSTGNMMTYMAQEYEKLSPAEKENVRKNSESVGTQMGQQFMGGKPETSEGTFMGKPVTITKAGSMTSQVWKGTPIVLKMQGSIMGMRTDQVATSIKEGADVPADKLQPPAGIQVMHDPEGDAMMRQMAKNMLDNLKDPDFEKKGGMGGMMAPPMGAGQGQGMQQDSGGDSGSGSGIPLDVDALKKKLGF